MPATILTYHKVGSHVELAITTVRRRRFAGHMDLLACMGVDPVTARVAARERTGSKALAVTFDDGYESVYTDAFPEMQTRGIPGTVFPVVGSVGGWNEWDVNFAPRQVRHLSWVQLRELAMAGFEVGSHTLTHRDLTRLDSRALRRELRDSKKMIEDRIGAPVTSLSYPFGRYSHVVLDEAVSAGYTCGFTSFPVGGNCTMAIGRWAVYTLDGAATLKRKMGLGPGRRLERLKSKMIAKLSLGTTLVKRS
jgi:peptidoglycan/xylan/chitin deacetylase (PgdA/CDA1 family)